MSSRANRAPRTPMPARSPHHSRADDRGHAAPRNKPAHWSWDAKPSAHGGGVRYGRFTARTTDLDEARSIGAQTFFPQQLIAFDRSNLDFTLKAARLGALTVGRMSYNTAVRLDHTDLDVGYQINISLNGAVDSRCGSQEIVSTRDTAAMFNPHGRTQLRHWSADAVVLGLKIDRGFLEQQVQTLTGTPVDRPVAFRMGIDMAEPCNRTWVQLLNVLAGLLDDTVTDTLFDVLADRLNETLVSALLLSVPNNYSDALHAPVSRWEPTAVKRAVQAIEERPEHPWTAKELADTAGVSVRSLQTAFGRIHDRTLFTYLRDVRLDRVHAELRRGQRQVSEVAADYGFTHLGRFAGYYKNRFGVHPKTTLRGSRITE